MACAWPYCTITLANVDLSSLRSIDNHHNFARYLSYQLLKLTCMEIIDLLLQLIIYQVPMI